VSRVYLIEALGSMAGALVFSFVLAPRLNAWQVAALAAGVALLAAGWAVGPHRARYAVAALRAAVAMLLACPRCLDAVEQASVRARWRAFGVLPRAAAARPAGPSVRVLASRDSRYQNLALVEAGGQFALYGNGQVFGVYPDAARNELTVRFIMAQNPRARRVLLLGGNPAGVVPELLRFPLERLVHVELDEVVGRMWRVAVERAGGEPGEDPRLERVTMDGPRYVKTCRETFDAVLILAPQPATAGLNRFYTAEFYRGIRRLLAPGGFAYAALETSEQLEREAANLGASVYRTLRAVFDGVLVTAGTPTQFFCGGADAALTLDPETLTARSVAAGVPARYFRPEYFLGADEISPPKLARVRGRLDRASVPLNTAVRPVSYYYELVLWSRLSGSGVAPVLRALERLPAGAWALIALAGGAVCLAGGAARRWRARGGANRRDAWARRMLGVAQGVMGFSGLALEVVLIASYQNRCGYVYSRMGLIIGLFMLGSALGALAGTRAEGANGDRRLRAAVRGLPAGLMLLAAVLGVGLELAPRLPGDVSDAALAWTLPLAVLLTGAIVGAMFVAATRLYRVTGVEAGAAAAALEGADYLGGALGGLTVGVFLVPVLGTGATCGLVAALGAAAVLCVTSACLAMPRAPAGHSDWPTGTPDARGERSC
jgi:spermidine synthase